MTREIYHKAMQFLRDVLTYRETDPALDATTLEAINVNPGLGVLKNDFLEILEEVTTLMALAYQQQDPVLPGHALAQEGLANGREVVLDYLEHGEAGVALEHLHYMIDEPGLEISYRSKVLLTRLARVLA